MQCEATSFVKAPGSKKWPTTSELGDASTESKDLWSMVTLQFLCSKGVVAVAESCDLHGLEGFPARFEGG